MAKLLQSLGCPNCGTTYDSKSRSCANCGIVLVPTSFAKVFGYDHAGFEVIVSIGKWRQVLKTEPDNVNAHFALGVAYLNSQFRDSALDHFRKAALLSPEEADIHYNLAVTLFNDGNIEENSEDHTEMVKEIEISLGLIPDFKEAMAFKYLFDADKLASVNARQALAEYHRAIVACSDIAAVWNNIGICHYKINNLAEALNCFRQAATLCPLLATAYSNLAYVMYKSANYDQGIKLASTALARMGQGEIAAHRADAHNILALCLWKSNRKADALNESKTAVAIAPNILVYQQNLKSIEGSGCFIVTATLGDHSHPWVIELCDFRDQILRQSQIGRRFMSFYYRTSPVLAELITYSTLLRQLSRIFIVFPAILFARLWSQIYPLKYLRRKI